MIKKDEVVKIGQFAKPHGTKGEIGLVTQFDLFDQSEDPYVICEIDGILVPFFIEEYRYKMNSVILLKPEKVNSEEEARKLSNLEVYYPLDAMPEEDGLGEITWDHFIGYEVTDMQHGLLGKITDVDESTWNVLMRVEGENKEWFIPAVEEIITEVDHDQKRLKVNVPEGLLDL